MSEGQCAPSAGQLPIDGSAVDKRICRLPGCATTFSPTQSHQRYCKPVYRFEAHRLRIAIPVAQQYLNRVLADLSAEGDRLS